MWHVHVFIWMRSALIYKSGLNVWHFSHPMAYGFLRFRLVPNKWRSKSHVKCPKKKSNFHAVKFYITEKDKPWGCRRHILLLSIPVEVVVSHFSDISASQFLCLSPREKPLKRQKQPTVKYRKFLPKMSNYKCKCQQKTSFNVDTNILSKCYHPTSHTNFKPL